MNGFSHGEVHRLFNAALDGTLTDAEQRQLAELLESMPEARELWFLYNDNECGLAELKPKSVLEFAPGCLATHSRSLGRRWRLPTAAAVAGVLLGAFFCASALWAMVVPKVFTVIRRQIPVFEESFENPQMPWDKGVPATPGHWGQFYGLSGCRTRRRRTARRTDDSCCGSERAPEGSSRLSIRS